MDLRAKHAGDVCPRAFLAGMRLLRSPRTRSPLVPLMRLNWGSVVSASSKTSAPWVIELAFPCGKASGHEGESKPHTIAAFEMQTPRLGGRRDLHTQILQDPPDLRHLLGVRRRQFAFADVKRILQPNPHITGG